MKSNRMDCFRPD